jgi:hypothetical protein
MQLKPHWLMSMDECLFKSINQYSDIYPPHHFTFPKDIYEKPGKKLCGIVVQENKRFNMQGRALVHPDNNKKPQILLNKNLPCLNLVLRTKIMTPVEPQIIG